ncbi:MAG: protein kinase, partial [Planctomycetales bacterium]|nr:protein kinase [Planctomycetales bacterium]
MIVDEHLFNWLDARFSAAEQAARADESSSQRSVEQLIDHELLDELNRLDDCTSLMERVWPQRNNSSTSGTETLKNEFPDDMCGRFEIRGLLGAGGMATVFRAYDPVLERDIALKIPYPGLMLDPTARERFAREAKAAGLLRHPNIVRVFEFGQVGGIWYLALEYCEGPSMSEWLAKPPEPLTVDVCLRMIIAIAEAVQHAHDRGVIHRDLKPGNIIMDAPASAADETSTHVTPRVTDFGLARVASANSELTRSGTTLGTAEFMSPEQIRGKGDAVDQATDQFSLGTILYLMLTGVSPFRREQFEQTVLAVCESDPTRPSRLNPSVPKDLDAVCLKAMEKQPANRYATVGQFADDLLRVLQKKPTVARPVSRAEASRRWIVRHPSLSFSILTVMIAAIVGVAAAVKSNYALARTAELLYAARIQLADQAIKSGNAQQAYQHLAHYAPQSGTADVSHRRDFAWHCLWSSLHREAGVIHFEPDDIPTDLCYSRDGSQLAIIHATSRLRWLDTATFAETAELALHDSEVITILEHNDQLYTVAESGDVAIVDFVTHQVVQLASLGQAVEYAAVLPRRRQVLAGAFDGVIALRSIEDDTLVNVGRHREIRAIAVAPNEHLAVSVGGQSSVLLWNLDKPGSDPNLLDDELLGSATERRRRFDTVVFSPDNKWLATGDNWGGVFIWNIASRTVHARLSGHTSNIYDLEFSPDGSKLLSASKDSTLR